MSNLKLYNDEYEEETSRKDFYLDRNSKEPVNIDELWDYRKMDDASKFLPWFSLDRPLEIDHTLNLGFGDELPEIHTVFREAVDNNHEISRISRYILGIDFGEQVTK